MAIFGWGEEVKAAGQGATSVIEAIGSLYTTDGEAMDKQAILNKIAQQPALLQGKITQVEAAHRSIFVAGWRPAIGWICALGIGFAFIGNPLLARFVGGESVDVPLDMILELVLAMLGMGVLRTVEKIKGVSK